MADKTSQPRNRRERRAAAAASGSSTKPAPDDIPMRKPDYDAKPAGKTLYQIVDERYAEMQRADPSSSSASGHDPASAGKGASTSAPHATHDPDPIGPLANALVYTISLSMLHITLDVLVLSQYHQDISWRAIASRLTRMTPALFLVVYALHRDEALRWRRARQALFLVLAVSAGCYLIYAGNVHGYYFVMRRAPPVGTLWVWSVVEMELGFAVLHAVVVLGYMRWNKFKMF